MDVVSYLLGKNAGGGGEVNLQEKSETITTNTTTNITPDTGYDGLSKVTVTTNVSGGGDLSEYFVTEITSNITSYSQRPVLVKKTPTITLSNDVVRADYLFSGSQIESITLVASGLTRSANMFADSLVKNANLSGVDFSGFSTLTNFCNNSPKLRSIDFGTNTMSSVYSMSNLFYSCPSLYTLNLSNWITSQVTNFSNMFYGCTTLRVLDIRNFTFDGNNGNPSYTNMFSNFNNSCKIIVKSDTERDWISTRFPDLSNIVTVAEL